MYKQSGISHNKKGLDLIQAFPLYLKNKLSSSVVENIYIQGKMSFTKGLQIKTIYLSIKDKSEGEFDD
jgi:hypothetical protein